MAFPASPTAGDTYTTPGGVIFTYTAYGAWKASGSSGSSGSTTPLSWTTATRPASPSVGTTGYNTTLSVLETWNGTSWAAVSSSGSGSPLVYTASQAASGQTSLTFSSLPAGLTRIEVFYTGLGWGPASGGYTVPGVQLGTSGGAVTTGYVSSAGGSGDSVAMWNYFADCIPVGAYCHPEPGTITGSLTLTKGAGNLWMGVGVQSAYGGTTYAAQSVSSGYISLSGVLTSLKFMNTVGRTFSYGNVFIGYA